MDDLKHLAPRGELPAATTLVVVHGSHEINLIVRVVAFARRGIDLPATFDFVATLALAAIHSDIAGGTLAVHAAIQPLATIGVSSVSR